MSSWWFAVRVAAPSPLCQKQLDPPKEYLVLHVVLFRVRPHASVRFGPLCYLTMFQPYGYAGAATCGEFLGTHVFHMFDCLGTVYHNVRRLDNDNITATVLQCSIAQWDSSVQISGISRSHVVLHKLDTAFSLYCGRSGITTLLPPLPVGAIAFMRLKE